MTPRMGGRAVLFHRIEFGQCVAVGKGQYRQLPLYRRNGHLYAAVSKTVFIMIFSDGGTSRPDIYIDPKNIDLADSDFGIEKDGPRWRVFAK